MINLTIVHLQPQTGVLFSYRQKQLSKNNVDTPHSNSLPKKINIYLQIVHLV